MKFHVMKPGEALAFEISPAALKDGFERGAIGGAWTARREDDRDGDWITVEEVYASIQASAEMTESRRDLSSVRGGRWRGVLRRLFGA